MRINRITLKNFGSYEGANFFETKTDNKHNIVLIGGKNGTGKTTLFMAIKLCLYGFSSMGYKNANSYYNKSIVKLINNNAKKNKPCLSSVSLDIDLNNGSGIDNYILSRHWTLENVLSEEFNVVKNNSILKEEEIADFEKYILSIIPPELFNLYFFDGEKIADFFLNEGSNTRIKEAFLTLCGYDTFDIMQRNFKRISTSSKEKQHASLNTYLETREQYLKDKEKLEKLQDNLLACSNEIENCNADINSLEKEYSNSGGITQEEWNKKVLLLKEEERKRDNWNSVLRKWANDTIPFLMVIPILKKVKNQIKKENDGNKYNNFMDILRSPELAGIIGDRQDEIEKVLLSKYSECTERILDLSFEQSANILSSIIELLDFDINEIAQTKQMIKQSIKKSSKIRKELEESNISTAQEYMRLRAELFEKKSNLLDKRLKLEEIIQQQKEIVSLSFGIFSKAQAELESEIKKESIADISAKAIIMIDRLMSDLYKRQIAKVEYEFKHIINLMMRKSQFIDDICIDEKFYIHVFRNEKILGKKLKEIISSNTSEKFVSMFGSKALEFINNKYGRVIFGEILPDVNDNEKVILPVEIDKDSFSNGEKQIFIMALYYSIVKLGNHEIPFIIDTPFARIDTEHRQNIAKYFFNELKGQLFILSTNEEITSEHINLLHDKISIQYLLENTNNKKTVILRDSYFEA